MYKVYLWVGAPKRRKGNQWLALVDVQLTSQLRRSLLDSSFISIQQIEKAGDQHSSSHFLTDTLFFKPKGEELACSGQIIHEP